MTQDHGLAEATTRRDHADAAYAQARVAHTEARATLVTAQTEHLAAIRGTAGWHQTGRHLEERVALFSTAAYRLRETKHQARARQALVMALEGLCSE